FIADKDRLGFFSKSGTNFECNGSGCVHVTPNVYHMSDMRTDILETSMLGNKSVVIRIGEPSARLFTVLLGPCAGTVVSPTLQHAQQVADVRDDMMLSEYDRALALQSLVYVSSEGAAGQKHQY